MQRQSALPLMAPVDAVWARLTAMSMLHRAFRLVKANRGAGGVDKVSIAGYERHLDQNLRELRRQLRQGTYAPLPVRRVWIPKTNGDKRPLGIPAIRDRIVQQALRLVLEPYFESTFADTSYGFRPRRSALQAVHKVEERLIQGCAWIVEADIKDFFTTLNHDRLLDLVCQCVPDPNIRKLVESFLTAGVMEEGIMKQETAGTPQGGVISPLLANIYLNGFDHIMEGANLILVRYADDFVVLCTNPRQARYALRKTQELMASLGLALAPAKTAILRYREGFDFLGYRFQQYYGNHKGPRKKAMDAFKDKIRFLTRRQQPKNVKMVVEKLVPVIRGWGNYFRHGQVKMKFEELDGWVRMRLRSFIAKQKWPAGRNWQYPNSHFRRLGLISLADLLIPCHGATVSESRVREIRTHGSMRGRS